MTGQQLTNQRNRRLVRALCILPAADLRQIRSGP